MATVAAVGTPLNQSFYTGVVPLATGVLNPANTIQTVWDCGTAYNYASMTTVLSGAPASTTIVLEGSFDGINWTVLATSTSVTGDTQFSSGAVPFASLRARCLAVSGGSSPTVTIAVVAYQDQPTPAAGGQVPVVPAVPTAANIVGGSNESTTTGGTVITIPAGRTWRGTVGLTIDSTGATTNTFAAVRTAGTGVVPAAGTDVCAVAESNASPTTSNSTQLSCSDIYVQAPAGNSVTLITFFSVAPTQVSAWANGILL